MKLSASKIERALRCPASMVLPRTVEAESSDRAARGTAIHAFLERVVKLMRSGRIGIASLADARDEALATVPDEWRLACECIDLQWMVDKLGLLDPAVQFAVEVGMWWNPETDEAAFTGEHRSHPAPEQAGADNCITGIADLILIHPNGFAVFDYKTGRSTTRAQENPQLLTLAVMASKAFGEEILGEWGHADGGVIYVRDDAWFDHAEWDGWDLIAHEAEIRGMLMRSPTRTEMVPGPWCNYCESFNSCDAQVGLLRAASLGTAESAAMAALLDGEAAKALSTLKLIKGLVGRLQAQLQGYVQAHGPIELGNGLIWGPRESHREALDGELTYATIASRFGEAVALAAVQKEGTKTRLREALRPVAKDRKLPLAQVEREALHALRVAGAIEVKQSTTYDEHSAVRRHTQEE